MKKEIETMHIRYVGADEALRRLTVDEIHAHDLKMAREAVQAIGRILRRIMAEDRNIKTR